MSRKSRKHRSPTDMRALKKTMASPLVPLGALAAGFGFMSPVMAQAPASPSTAREATLPTIAVKGDVEFDEKKNVQVTTSSIGKGNQDIRDIPQSLNVITEKLIDDRKVDTLNQALRMTAGVTFSAAENGTQQDTFIRGFSVAQVGDLLIDGMKDPSQYDRDTFNYERIEVLRGSASMVFGRGSTGGVVNQVNKKPLLADLKEVTAMGGSNEYGRVTTDLNIRTGENSAVRVNGMYTNADNGGAEIKKTGVAPAYSWGQGTNNEFNVGLFYLDVDNVPMNGSPYAVLDYDIDASDYYGAASDYLEGEATYGTFQYTRHFEDGGALRTQVRTGKYDRAQWYSTYRLAAGTTADNFGDSTVITRVGLTPRKDEYKGTYLQSDYTNEYGWVGAKHALTTGVDAAYETADRFTSSNVGANFAKGTSTIGNPDDGFRTTVNPIWAPSNDYKSKSAGVYVQDLVQVLPDIKLLGGLRWDTIDGTFHTTVGAGAAAIRTTAELSDSMFSRRLGILYQPSETASFHMSYGTSFNTSGDTYQFTSAGGGTPEAQAASLQRNANTPPEKSKNFEVGAKLDWFDGNLSTRLAIFRTEKYNERTTDADFAGDAYLLSGKRHSQGWELEIAGRPLESLEIYTSYAFIPTTRIDEAGSAAQNTVGLPFGLVPKKSGSAWVTYQATEKLRVGTGVTASSENYSINGTTPTRGARAPGYAYVDALAEYYFTPDFYLQVNGTNLGDKVYASDLYRGFMLLGQGRTVKLSIGYTF